MMNNLVNCTPEFLNNFKVEDKINESEDVLNDE